ncbi:MAG TPA: hypothetical protein VHJ20_19865 [Polyangia bacterium]|nr:hypothetical protein [Polyangia bacterium]
MKPLAALALAAGCYSTTPHRAEVRTAATDDSCRTAVADVFEAAGMVRRPPPPGQSLFYGPRLAPSNGSREMSGAGIGVTVAEGELAAGRCHVTLEALAPDSSCPPGAVAPLAAGTGPWALPPVVTSPIPPQSCEITYAPGNDNDAAVDELARRLREALGAHAQVDVGPARAVR